jgi:hypothetical protein
MSYRAGHCTRAVMHGGRRRGRGGRCRSPGVHGNHASRLFCRATLSVQTIPAERMAFRPRSLQAEPPRAWLTRSNKERAASRCFDQNWSGSLAMIARGRPPPCTSEGSHVLHTVLADRADVLELPRCAHWDCRFQTVMRAPFPCRRQVRAHVRMDRAVSRLDDSLANRLARRRITTAEQPGNT